MVLVAKAYNLQAIDMVYINYKGEYCIYSLIYNTNIEFNMKK